MQAIYTAFRPYDWARLWLCTAACWCFAAAVIRSCDRGNRPVHGASSSRRRARVCSSKLGLTERHASAPVPATEDASDAYFVGSTMRHAESLPAEALPTQQHENWAQARDACASQGHGCDGGAVPGKAGDPALLQDRGGRQQGMNLTLCSSRGCMDQGYQAWGDERCEDGERPDEGCVSVAEVEVEAEQYCCSEGFVGGDAAEEDTACGPSAAVPAPEQPWAGRTGFGPCDAELVKQANGPVLAGRGLICRPPAGQAEFDVDIVNVAEQASILAMIQAKQRQKHDTAIQQQYKRRRMC